MIQIVCGVLLAALVQESATSDLPVLRPGDVIEGTIEETDPVIHTEILDANYTSGPTRGKTYRIERSESGPITIELHSHFFDAYLVLRGAGGVPIHEDDDGLVRTHSMIVVSEKASEPLLLDVCALHGKTGHYRVSIALGEPDALSPAEQRESALRDARGSVRMAERTFGPDHPLTATSLNDLALLLKLQGAYEEARPLYERALRIRESVLGPEHPDTAMSLGNLAKLFLAQRAYEEALPLFERELGIYESAPGPDLPRISAVLIDLAGVLKAQGAYEEARPLLERAHQIHESVFGPEHLRTVTSLNHLAGLFWAQGAYGEARPLLERALRIRESVLGPDHRDTATSLNSLALVFRAQGAFEEARSLYARALRIRESVLGPDHPDTAASLNNLGEVLGSQGAYKEARPLLERAHQICESVLGPEHLLTATSLNNLADLLEDQGAYEEARPLYARALRIRESVLGPDHRDTAQSLDNLAGLLKTQGAYEEARPLHERALRIHESALGPEHPATAVSLNNLAILLHAQGAYEEARPMTERALRINELALGPEHPATAMSLCILGSLLKAQGAYGEARPPYERALRIHESVLGPRHPLTAVTLSNLAGLLRAQGAYEEAQPLYERALQIHESVLGRNHPFTARSLNNLAGLLKAQGAYEEARSLYERALRIHEAALGPEHPATSVSLSNLAVTEFDLGELDAPLLRSRSAISTSRRHIDDLIWSMSESERLLFTAGQEWHLETFLSLSRMKAVDNAARECLGVVLGWKGQVIRSLVQASGSVVESLPDTERELLIRLRALQRQLSDLLYATEVPDLAAHVERLNDLRAERNRLEVELVRLRGRAEDGKPGVDRASVAILEDALPDGAAAIEFYAHHWYEPALRERGRLVRAGTWTAPHLSAWVVRAGGDVEQFDLGEAEVVHQAVNDFLTELTQNRGKPVSVGSSSTEPTAANDRLRQLLWDPLADAIGDVETIYVSPDTFLGMLPLETLRREDGRYVVEQVSLSYISDLQSLAEVLARRDSAELRLLVAGGINYRKGASPPGKSAELASGDRRAALSRIWRSLQWTEAEAGTIAEIHSMVSEDDGSQLVLTGSDATEERIKQSLPDFAHIHLATHGYFHPEELPSAWRNIRNRDDKPGLLLLREAERHVVGYHPGLLSGLVFAGANAEPEPGRDNGLLTAEEISFLDLSNCDLVVLSACETGLGRPEAGEGMIGLRRAFRMAGARTVISSLWEVSDASTRDLMTLFYENLWLKKMPKLEALRQAQLSLLEHNRKTYGDARPSTWGAFVLDGAPE